MSDYYSTSSGWLIPISRAMDANNIDLEQVLKACDIELTDFQDQESRVAVSKMTRLLCYCNDIVESKNFVIQVCDHFHPGVFHALGYAMLSSNTLLNALQRIAQYKRVVSNTCILHVFTDEHGVHCNMEIMTYEETSRSVIENSGVELFLATIAQIAKRMVGANFKPEKVSFTFTSPSSDKKALEEYFDCAIQFGANVNGITFNTEQANEHLMSGNPLITQAHEKMLDEFMSRIDKNDLTHVIRNKIYDLLPLGAPSQTQIATQLGMSLRNLQRRLNEQGTSYKEILEQTRKKLTMDYIQQPHLALCEIGYLVGFSSIGNFNRAFKRWTGIAPGQYRSQNLNSGKNKTA